MVRVVSRPEHSVGSTAGRGGITGSGLEGMGAHRVEQTDDDQAKGVAMGTGD